MKTKTYVSLGVAGVAAALAIGLGQWIRSRRREDSAGSSAPSPPPRGDHPGWHRTPLASLDLETTGVDPETDRIVSYALLGDMGGEISGLVNPGVPIPSSSSDIHGLTEEMLAGASSPAAGIGLVLEWVQSLIDRRVGLVVFNSPFDLTMLRAEASRWGLTQPAWDRLLVVDPYVIGWGIDPRGRGPRKLTDVAGRYGVALDNAHDAVADARAAREIAYELGARHRAVAVESLGELMTLQQTWFRERAEDWNAYARTVDRPLNDPSGWPLVSQPKTMRSA